MDQVAKFMVPHDDDICITGLAGRFPKSESLDELIYHLYNGINCSSNDNSRWIKGRLPSKFFERGGSSYSAGREPLSFRCIGL